MMTGMPEPQIGTYEGDLVVLRYRGASDRLERSVDVQDSWGSLAVLRTNHLVVTHRRQFSPTSMSTYYVTADLRSFYFEATEQPRECEPQDWGMTDPSSFVGEQLDDMQLLSTVNSPFMVGPIRHCGSYGTSGVNVLICETEELEQYLPAILAHMGVDPQDVGYVEACLRAMIVQGEREYY